MTKRQPSLIRAIASVASRWESEDYAVRRRAVRKTIAAANRFTEESVTFALNQQIHELNEENLKSWLRGRESEGGSAVAVLNAGNVPFVELQDFLAVILTGHRYRGSVSSRSPYLLPAFAGDVSDEYSGLDIRFVPFPETLDGARAVIATGSAQTAETVIEACESIGIDPSSRLIRGPMFAAAVIDGSESASDRSGLAEDLLLHDGSGCRSVAVIWAPRGLNPDPLLDTMAQFREVIPPHPDVNGTLSMARALYAATDQAHAYGDGFLISKGPPEFQQPGHIRWVEYESLDEVITWLEAERRSVQGVVASERLAGRIPTSVPVWQPGEAQRPKLDWCADGRDTIEFLVNVGGP